MKEARKDKEKIEPMFLTTAQAAEHMSCAKSTIYRWASKNIVPVHKVMGSLRFDREELNDWVMGTVVVCRSCGCIYKRIYAKEGDEYFDEFCEKALDESQGLLFSEPNQDELES